MRTSVLTSVTRQPDGLARLLSVAEFAQTLGVTVACIRRWLLERRITFSKIGRLVRIPASEADRLIAEGLHPAKPRRAQ